MGINIGAKLLYGVPYSDLPEEILDEVNAMLDDDQLDYASPYYDAPRGEWIVGAGVELWGDSYIDLSWSDFCSHKGIRILGNDLKFYVTPHVC